MPYCPACRADYAPGIARCHDCEVDLEESLPEAPAEPDRLPPEPMVTIASFDTPTKANIMASRLEADGVECFIADAETIGIHGLLAGAVGGVKIQVRESDAQRAAAIVRNNSAGLSGTPSCPRCGSAAVRRKGLSIPLGLLVVLTLGILALVIPVVWVCGSCSHRWK